MDEALVLRARQGDKAAFEALVVANHERLFKLAQGILRDPHLAEDATQQAFLDIWRDINQLRDPARFEAWTYRLLVRVCYRAAREQRNLDAKPPELMDRVPASPDAFAALVERDQLERGFATLSMDHRVVIAMRFLLDMSPAEIAVTLGISRRTVYSRLKRAVPAMRAALESDERPVIRPVPDHQEAS